ncbi:pyridoxamine 5'-phosphate oxidase family protein [Desulfotomaculum copahuensis]|uniref:Pyridoxamine 5'-phosphate oxidase n=1 Tax=Desulfotomaculum copahuensis TaxID=1838280 RepID=A0A1B7LB37_9FIRM|nr:pyridoxamine 5'-phosphate oxidase family protein [Desulfotomaculum copahuensis]OAT79535.1 pyridoxamine 5'-phosphate oxidase [Desulfotomaculum copahuensis]
MSKLTTEVKNVISRQGVFPIATASRDGVPNVVPMTFVKVYDDENLLVVDNFMHKTKQNIESNPYMSICVWDQENKLSYQIKGKVTIHDLGPVFDQARVWVKEKMPALQPKSAVLLKVTNIYVCQPGESLGQEL